MVALALNIWSARLWTGVLVTVVFSALARRLRAVSFSGSLAGAFICFTLYAVGGVAAFAVLVSVFVLTWLSTQFGDERKQALGTAENRRGRSGSQVVANLSVAALFAVLSALSQRRIFLLASVAALAEVAADTVSSEIGQSRSNQPRMITTWEVVPAGTNGGISLTGTLSGIVAAAIVSSVAALVGLVSIRDALYPVIAALVGMTADSCMGAALERRNLLNNNSVNFLSTFVAAAVLLLMA